jgi:BMFP domain-containing protein YqiC
MDIVTREEFEAVKVMATKAREENERLSALISVFEARVATLEAEIGRTKAGA